MADETYKVTDDVVCVVREVKSPDGKTLKQAQAYTKDQLLQMKANAVKGVDNIQSLLEKLA
jgi:hypothetical protein